MQASSSVELPVLRVVEDVEAGSPQSDGGREDDGFPTQCSPHSDPRCGRGDRQCPTEEEAAAPCESLGKRVEDQVRGRDGREG